MTRNVSDISLYAPRRWVADALGMSVSTFDSKRVTLEQQGFPKRDAVIGLYLKADVEAWVMRRRQVADKVKASEKPEEVRINADRL